MKTKKEPFPFVVSAADIYTDMITPLADTLEKLKEMRQEIGPRGVRNLYVYDDIHACIYLTEALREKIGELLSSSDAIALDR